MFGLDLSRRKPPVSPETVQAHVSAVQTVRQAKARGDTRSLHAATRQAHASLHALLKEEERAGWRG